MRLDLLDTNSVRSFAKAFKSKYNKLDRLINNAGVSEPGITEVTVTSETVHSVTECLNCSRSNRYNCSICNNAAAV
jgi:NADP-dependent 3-hydroxy acid dehydrogenase YdfG